MTAITELKTSILAHLERGSVGLDVLQSLQSSEGVFIERETELWDYKSVLGPTKLDQAELVRDILAFHNTFGGYLFFGVSDDGLVSGSDSICEQTTRQLLRNYAAVDVPISVAHHKIRGCEVHLIIIPKRSPNDVPVAISKVGPDVTGGRPIFKPGDIFLRSNDSSQLIRGSDDLRFLMGERRHSADNAVRKIGARITPNNLPDRSVVFNRFFGRDEVKEALWTWLADPMSRYRVLAGPGGVGKTSAAYSFCEEVCIEPPLGFEQVVWLSAKRYQFSPSRNEPTPLPYKGESRTFGEAYSSFDTLLDAISYHLPLSDDEWEGYDHGFKMRRLSEALSVIPTLVVADDLDSLSPDDQRLAVEFAMSLGRSSSRFLFTTRKNYLAPASSTTEIRGLSGDEFSDFVDYLQAQYGRTLTGSERKTLAQDTEGSPLFTESIFRLLKLGIRFSEALSRWKGADGEAVRAASFRRELEQLSWASKRVLFAISMFDTASTAEIRSMAELEASEVESAISDLDRLFLVQSKQIGDQARFGIAPNLKRLLQDVKAELIPNHTEISRRAANLRSETRQGLSRGNNKEIAMAIQQAMAQLGGGDAAGSLFTIEGVLKAHRDSADLWMVYARCLCSCPSIDTTKVRNAFQKSFNLGKREPQLFLKWIEFEIESGNSNAAVDVGEKGAEVIPHDDSGWLAKRAIAHFKRGCEREARREFIDAMSDMSLSAGFLAKAFKRAPGSEKSSIATGGQQVHDAIWRIVTQPGQYSIPERYKFAKLAVDFGDRRETCLLRMIDAVEFGVLEPSYRAKHLSQLEKWIQDIEKALEIRYSERANERLSVLRKLLVD